MKKITTLFRKDPNDLSRVIKEINPENEWVIDYGIGTRKYDGTACAIIDGDLYKRYDAKKGKSAPIGAIPCQDADPITGHHPHWVKCDRNDPSNKYHFEAFDKLDHTIDGTYELCGEKIQGNPERLTGHELIPHGAKVFRLKDWSFEAIREFLKHNDYEGIVFHHSDPNDERMCKIRKSDFGFKR